MRTIATLALLALVGCEAPESKEDLNHEGPPMIRQVIMRERVVTGTTSRSIVELAFGQYDHAFFANTDNKVTTAAVQGTQEFRIILDEQIRGNSIEEIQCTDESWSAIPNGTDPDDIEDCIGPDLSGCNDICFVNGQAVGILDSEGAGPTGTLPDGVADNYRMRDYSDSADTNELAVSVMCDDVEVPMSQNLSFWNPSGNQTFPSNPDLSYKGLGPAIVLRAVDGIGIRTSSTCIFKFRPEVTDYDDNQVCAPENGDPEKGCEAGDVSRISFGTEALLVTSSSPKDGAVDVKLTSGSSGLSSIGFNTAVSSESVTGLTLTADGVAVDVVGIVPADNPTIMNFLVGTIAAPQEFQPETDYVLTIGVAVTDALGGPLQEAVTISWRTEAAPVPPFQSNTSASL